MNKQSQLHVTLCYKHHPVSSVVIHITYKHKSGNLRINVTLRRVRVTTVALEKQ